MKVNASLADIRVSMKAVQDSQNGTTHSVKKNATGIQRNAVNIENITTDVAIHVADFKTLAADVKAHTADIVKNHATHTQLAEFKAQCDDRIHNASVGILSRISEIQTLLERVKHIEAIIKTHVTLDHVRKYVDDRERDKIVSEQAREIHRLKEMLATSSGHQQHRRPSTDREEDDYISRRELMKAKQFHDLWVSNNK